MIRQDDPRFQDDPEIAPFGCAFWSYLFLANKLTNCALGVSEIKALITKYRTSGWLQSEMYVAQPDMILSDLGVHLFLPVRVGAPDYICEQNEFEILSWEYTDSAGAHHKHWTPGDGQGHCAFDSLGRSYSVRLGKVTEKRIITEAVA